MKLKKMVTTAAVALSLTSSGLGTVSAFAANTGDTTWTNQYSLWSQNDHTPARRKSNKTAYYNYTKKVSNNGYFTIWAALYDGRAVNRGKDCVDHSYRSAQGQVNYLWNLAVEKYGSGVSVRVNSTSMQNITASGVWSPDSV